jgi:hypothetical protein
MLRGEAVDLREVTRRSRVASTPDHLRDWVTKSASRKGNNLGDVRYGTIRWLYRFYELVLRRRYPAECQGNAHRLDRAFARVLGRDEDLVKKLRQELARGLNQMGAPRASE